MSVMGNNHIDYLLSLHILNELKEKNLITEEEFIAIDNENKKSFKVADNQYFNLIICKSRYNMNVQKEYKFKEFKGGFLWQVKQRKK